MGDIARARLAAAEMYGRDFDDPLLHAELGTLLHQLGDHAAAVAQYDRALRLDPRNAGHHFNRAAVLRYLGDGAGAEAGFDAAIAINPDEYEAYNGRAHVRTQTRERNHVEELRARHRAHARAGRAGPAPLRARQGARGPGRL